MSNITLTVYKIGDNPRLLTYEKRNFSSDNIQSIKEVPTSATDSRYIAGSSLVKYENIVYGVEESPSFINGSIDYKKSVEVAHTTTLLFDYNKKFPEQTITAATEYTIAASGHKHNAQIKIYLNVTSASTLTITGDVLDIGDSFTSGAELAIGKYLLWMRWKKELGKPQLKLLTRTAV